MRMPAELSKYATVIRIVRLENEGRRIFQVCMSDRDQGASCTRRNQQLKRRRFWIDLNVVEACDLLRDGFAQVAHTFRRAVVIATRLYELFRSPGQFRIDRQLGLALYEISAWGNESRNGPDFRLRFRGHFPARVQKKFFSRKDVRNRLVREYLLLTFYTSAGIYPVSIVYRRRDEEDEE